MTSRQRSEDLYPWERSLGARQIDDQTAEFRVWAPRADSLSLKLSGRELALRDAGHGVLEAVVPARGGEDYSYIVDGQELPDPCSRWQPQGLRGPSRLFDSRSLPGSGDGFKPVSAPELVVYELHVGTFTEPGTFAAVADYLPGLAGLGVTATEIGRAHV